MMRSLGFRAVCTLHQGIMLLQISSEMPQLRNLQKVEALRQTRSGSTSRFLQISQLVQVRTDLQYNENVHELRWQPQPLIWSGPFQQDWCMRVADRPEMSCLILGAIL